jgi:hypothetical protein
MYSKYTLLSAVLKLCGWYLGKTRELIFNYMISTSMPWVATAGNGWKRHLASGVNGADMAIVLHLSCISHRTDTHEQNSLRICVAEIRTLMPACMHLCGMH